ncbi:hypothetical protein OMP43_21710 [Sphingomonas sp. CBMAI 2297]|uniref:hypothetical protein n=1 Tax=Sphingomonas sp. CBMAI 2297 TaxID=2991720 RepID=UPI002455ACC8|nr:hypothetical protein [Sphingomonas sp. CBMAI 2297]MDH4746647.1 hypothetical protein [Sphingomonas sp. CBMAI 2297]
MTDLSGLISAAVAAKMTPEFIEKEVDARVGKLIVESVDKALRTWSDTGKLIEKAVEEALRVERIDLPSYGSVVAGMVKAQVEANVAEIIAGRLKEDVEQLLSLAPKTVKLSKIAADMIESRHGEGWGEVITVIVEHTDYGYVRVWLDDDEVIEPRDKYRCAVNFSLDKDGKIFSATLEGKDIKSAQKLGGRYGLEQKIRAYYAVGTIIEIDEDAVITSIGDC